MSHGPQLTSSATAKRVSALVLPGTAGGAGPQLQDRFDHVLSACRQVPQSRLDSSPRGMTIPDYLANPIRALSFLLRTETGRETAVTEAGVSPPEDRPAEAGNGGEGSAVIAEAPDAPDGPPGSGRQNIDPIVRRAARTHGLPEALILGVIEAESGFRADAVSPAGACGLMQLMPGTAQELGVSDPFDPAENIDAGSRYLRRMLDLFEGDLRQALMAYNAGPGAVRRYQGDVPFSETRQYVDRVLRFSGLDATPV